MKILRPLVVSVVLVVSSLAQAFAADAKSEAARVAIIRYIDKTNTQNFEYMPGSLQEAITESMKKKFEFIEVDPTKVEPIVSQVLAKNNGVMGPKEAAEVCRLADIDILIYGNFTFKEADNQIVIHTEISLGSTDKFRKIEPTENPVDATIFRAADKVAGDIVAEIAKVAQEQQIAKGEEAEKDKKGKTQLDKIEKSKTWADIHWTIGPSLGIYKPLVRTENLQSPVNPNLDLQVSYRLSGAWHVGLVGKYAELLTRSRNNPFVSNMNFGAAAATGGYYFDLSPRWRWTNDLGFGYYYGILSVFNEHCNDNLCGISPNEGRFVLWNPFFMARTGIQFLLFSFVSVGFQGEYIMLYDGNPVHGVGASFALSIVF